MKKVLAVDDDLYMLELYSGILKEAGMEVQTAEDAMSAVSKYQEFKPDLIILDVDMPAGGGQKVFDRLRNLFQSTTPIIFSTGMPEKVLAEAKASNVSVMKKPFTAPALVEEVKRLLG